MNVVLPEKQKSGAQELKAKESGRNLGLDRPKDSTKTMAEPHEIFSSETAKCVRSSRIFGIVTGKTNVSINRDRDRVEIGRRCGRSWGGQAIRMRIFSKEMYGDKWGVGRTEIQVKLGWSTAKIARIRVEPEIPRHSRASPGDDGSVSDGEEDLELVVCQYGRICHHYPHLEHDEQSTFHVGGHDDEQITHKNHEKILDDRENDEGSACIITAELSGYSGEMSIVSRPTYPENTAPNVRDQMNDDVEAVIQIRQINPRHPAVVSASAIPTRGSVAFSIAIPEPRPPEPLSLTPPGANSTAGDTSYAGAGTTGANAQANANASATRSPTSPVPHHPGPIVLLRGPRSPALPATTLHPGTSL
ncbi:hypothetical protein B0H11DRAFT_2184604 [Mycena galericulata]|nr:hypothetical protein B0H11DRAFT_2184604 [Mycena galericulata]